LPASALYAEGAGTLVVGTPVGGAACVAASGELGAAPASTTVGEAADGDAGRDGTLGTDCTPGPFGTAGTRGKEYISLTAGNVGAAVDAPFSPSRKWGDEPGTVSEAGVAARSVPPGGAVGGDDGIAGTPGNENISLAGGSVETANGEAIFPPARKSGGDPGTGDGATVPGAPGTSAIAPANDAGIARKSASVNCPLGVDEGGVGKLGGEATPGTPGNANISFTGGNDVDAVMGEALSASGMLGSGLGATGGTASVSAGDEAIAVLP